MIWTVKPFAVDVVAPNAGVNANAAASDVAVTGAGGVLGEHFEYVARVVGQTRYGA